MKHIVNLMYWGFSLVSYLVYGVAWLVAVYWWATFSRFDLLLLFGFLALVCLAVADPFERWKHEYDRQQRVARVDRQNAERAAREEARPAPSDGNWDHWYPSLR